MVQDDKLNKTNELKSNLAEAEAIIGRLKETLQVKSDGQLANYLGISRQNIGAARKRDDVPAGWIYKVAELTGCSMDWLRFGQGAKIRVQYGSEASPHDGRIAAAQSPYVAQGHGEAGSVHGLDHDEESTGFGAAVEMLAKIYGSEDKLLIGTINASIRAFCEAIDRKQRERSSTEELDNLKKRLATIEKQLQRGRPNGEE
jgi:hypothetical protein